MKLYSVNKERNEGAILVPTNVGYTKRLDFPLDTLFDWYPCCPRYDYKYSDTRDKMYIVMIEENGKLPLRYNVPPTKKRVKSKTACFITNTWYNQEVANDNKKLFSFAENYDIVTPNKENYTLEDVNNSIERVQDILDMLYTVQEKQVEKDLIVRVGTLEKEAPDSEELKAVHQEIKEYMQLDREGKASHVLSLLPQHVEELYANFGEVYTMLNLMKKVV